MKAINIDIYFEDELLHMRIDMVEDRNEIERIAKHLHHLESFAVNAVSIVGERKGIREHSYYQDSLRYALAYSIASTKYRLDDNDPFTLFDVSRNEATIPIHFGDVKQEFLHSKVIYKLPANSQIIINLLACLSLYVNEYYIRFISFQDHLTFYKNIIENNPFPEKQLILPIIQKIVSLKDSIHANAYQSVIQTLDEISKEYQRKWLPKNKFTFLDLDCMNHENDHNRIHDAFLNLTELFSSDTLEKKSACVLNTAKKILTHLSHQEINTMLFLFDFDDAFKHQLRISLLGKTAHDGGVYKEGYTEIAFLDDAEISLRQDGRVSIRNIQENESYKRFYSPEPERKLAIKPILEQEIPYLAQHLGCEVEVDCDFDNEIIFNLQSTPMLMQSGFLDNHLFKTIFYFQYLGNFIMQSRLAPETFPGENQLKLLPEDILPFIILNSSTHLNFPFGFVLESIRLGMQEGKDSYARRPKYIDDGKEKLHPRRITLDVPSEHHINLIDIIADDDINLDMEVTNDENLQTLKTTVDDYKTLRETERAGFGLFEYTRDQKIDASTKLNEALLQGNQYINQYDRKILKDGRLCNNISQSITNSPVTLKIRNDVTPVTVDELIDTLNKRNLCNALIAVLNTYREERINGENTYYSTIFKQFTKQDKLNAAEKLIALLRQDHLTEAELYSLTNGEYFAALNQGNLGKRIRGFIDEASDTLAESGVTSLSNLITYFKLKYSYPIQQQPISIKAMKKNFDI